MEEEGGEHVEVVVGIVNQLLEMRAFLLLNGLRE
jgi:hypothetical protein